MESTTPVIAIVGRPNAGKSTLFNRLTRSRQALVDSAPGVTRDRLYGRIRHGRHQFTVIDTGGFDPPADREFAAAIHAQIDLAIEEANAVIFLTDGRQGLNPLDEEIYRRLRRCGKLLIVAVNKIDSPAQEEHASDFYRLSCEYTHFISAAHGYGMTDMLDSLALLLPEAAQEDPDKDGEGSDGFSEGFEGRLRVSLLGRPNVGKSSLLNALTQSQRSMVSDIPGTTRDALDTPFTRQGREYLFIDTAGIRRQARINSKLEWAGIFRSLRAVERSHVVCLLLDASQAVADQDLRLISQVTEAGRAMLTLINKIDLVKNDPEAGARLKREKERITTLAPWTPFLPVSALSGQGLNKIFSWLQTVFAQYNSRVSTSRLNQALEDIVARHSPPLLQGRRPKFFYATQTEVRPPTVVLFVNRPESIHISYQRYLHHRLREALGLRYSPLRLIYKARKKQA
ncbi:MAG: ribosome biogenesis GTPase Der [Desulfarculales bacterium]|jgi:GTP-binding protein|nr:ribosome biogenesis GTPase Der [Desulfarculales bacterium]